LYAPDAWYINKKNYECEFMVSKKRRRMEANNPSCMYSAPHTKLNAMKQHSMD